MMRGMSHAEIGVFIKAIDDCAFHKPTPPVVKNEHLRNATRTTEMAIGLALAFKDSIKIAEA